MYLCTRLTENDRSNARDGTAKKIVEADMAQLVEQRIRNA